MRDIADKIQSVMAKKKSDFAISSYVDDIENKYSGVGARKGKRSWKTGMPLIRGKVS